MFLFIVAFLLCCGRLAGCFTKLVRPIEKKAKNNQDYVITKVIAFIFLAAWVYITYGVWAHFPR